MKKSVIRLFLLAALLLGACSSAANVAQESGAAAEDAALVGADENALPESSRLIMGMMALEGEEALSAGQAQTLLPLWKAYRSLLESETTAAAELAGLLEQIQEEMTPEQVEAIAAMALSQESMQQIMGEQGILLGEGQGGLPGELDPERLETLEAMRENGEIPEGVFPGGGREQGAGVPMGGAPLGGEGIPMGGMNPEDIDPEQLATMQAARGNRDGQGTDRFLVNLVIAFLEGKLAE